MNLNSYLIEINGLSFFHNKHNVFDNIDIKFPRGKITAIMGPSGIGKTTLLHLISGRLLPNKGEIWVDGNNIPSLSHNKLYHVRKKISMLFQSGALFTDINVFDNIAFPLRQHTNLPFPILYSIVMMKLEAVGLRGAAYMMPSELSSGMIRRIALARAIALDPKLIMFDEPFVGQDPITMNILIKLISGLHHALDITCIIVSHDIFEVLSIADYAYIIVNKHIIAAGTPDSLRINQNPLVRQFLDGKIDGPLSCHIPTKNYQTQIINTKN